MQSILSKKIKKFRRNRKYGFINSKTIVLGCSAVGAGLAMIED